MKGIVLLGGRGSRLTPLTLACSKHLLPVYDEPMIFKVIRTLVDSGIDDICLVISKHVSNNINVLGDGSILNCRLTYIVQETPRGISDALMLARDFAKDEKVAVILGDNIFEDTFEEDVKEWKKDGLGCGAKVFLKGVTLSQAKKLGVASLKDGEIVEIEEKPENPKSFYAVTGLYFFDEYLFEYILYQKEHIGYSTRGELEITDTVNIYLKYGQLKHKIVDGFWVDAGNFESLLHASNLVKGHKLRLERL